MDPDRVPDPSWLSGAKRVLKHKQELLQLITHELLPSERLTMHLDQYHLIQTGWQIEVHRGALHALKRASLVTTPTGFDVVLTRVNSVSDSLHKFWLARVPHHSHFGAALETDAPHIYARPVARRWRRICRYVRWIARIAKWLPAFNESAFHPDSIAARLAATRFREASQSLLQVAQ